MTQAEAREILEKAMRAFQRFRSITAEIGVGESWLSQELWPWVYRDKCPLPAIQMILDRDKIVPMEFYNIMYIHDRFAQEVKMQAEIEHITQDIDFSFPTPDIRWAAEEFEG